MPRFQPDLSKVSAQPPPWRRPPKELEAPIQAWRVWSIDIDAEEGPRLCSVGVSFVWPGPVVRAIVPPMDPSVWDEIKPRLKRGVANASDFEQQAALWQGGIHVLKTPELAMWAAVTYRADVIGLVDLWGRVVQFEKGYKAELAMVRKLAYIDSKASFSYATPSLERTYACDVVPLRELIGFDPKAYLAHDPPHLEL